LNQVLFRNNYQERKKRSSLTMKILVEIYREGRFFIARDLLTKIADQGLTENEAVQNLKKGIADHYQLLVEMNLPGHKLTYLDIEVDNLVGTSPAVIP
jgi:predicted RNase H-like HicB family nuclease